MKRKSKLKQMAKDGNPWAIAKLAELQELGRAAGLRGAAMQRSPALPGLLAPIKDPLFAEAMRDARDIREWTDGPRVSSWRVWRLAHALCGRRV